MLIPVLAIGSCSGTVVVLGTAGDVVKGSIGAGAASAIDAALPMDFRVGLLYAIGAAVWVTAGAWIAPAHRTFVAMVLFVAGACLALFVIGSWFFPEGHPRAYQSSRVPLAMTLLGGLMALAAVAWKNRRR